MAADSPPESAPPVAGNAVIKTEPEDGGDDLLRARREAPVRREPAVPLQSPVSGLQPLSWSLDHRLAVCTSGSLAVMELRCDARSSKQELSLHRTHVSVPSEATRLRVGPSAELSLAREKFSSDPDPTVRQLFLTDMVMNPAPGAHRGMKYACWSPLGCGDAGRCLLACLTLDNRLTVHSSHGHLEWKTLVDLTHRYGQRLKDRGYAAKDDKPPEANLLDAAELQRRFRMQTPLRMAWSRVYATKKVQPDNSCADEEMVLLAVLMENGDLVLWKFELPLAHADPAAFYDVIESGVGRPSDVAWWEYDNGARQMGGLLVGSEAGPVKLLPVSLAKVRGYVTIRHPVVLWKESDDLAVDNIRVVPLGQPTHRGGCSLIVASRGCYVFWSLLRVSPAGLTVQNSHIAGLHSLPVLSLAVPQREPAIYTCSMDGGIKKLTPTLTETSVTFRAEDVTLPEALAGRRPHGMAVSRHGAYAALVSTQGMAGGFHPFNRNYQVHFLALKTADAAVPLLLESAEQSLYNAADLLDLVRWQVLKTKRVPAELDRRIPAEDSPYLWRLKLFAARVLQQSLKAPPAENKWRARRRETKVLVQDLKGDEKGEEEQVGGDKDGAEMAESESEGGVQRKKPEEHRAEVQTLIDAAEMHLMRENMKKVLGVVYLNTWVPQNTCIPTCGLMDYLSRDPDDRDSEVLIGHIKKKLNKQTFAERCSLCQAPLPFTDCKRAVCENGHVWLRCVLSYQACQTLTFRRCLLQDCVARLPEPEDPEWIKKLLTAPCLLCDSPMI